MENHEKAVTPHINITPLIDVLLVLLIIFMVVSPSKPARFEAKVPTEPKDSSPRPHPLSLTVTINENLELTINNQLESGTSSDTGKLSSQLAALFEERTKQGAIRENGDGIEKTVFIKAPRSVDYGEVVKVLDGVRGAGAEPIGLQIDDLAN